MTTTFSAAPLSAPNTKAVVAVTDKYVASGINTFDGLDPIVFPDAMLPIWGGPVNAAVPGVYLTASVGARFRFALSRHITNSGLGAAGSGSNQVLLTGDERSIDVNNRPIMRMTQTDQVIVDLIRCDTGSLTVSIVQ